MKGRKSSKALQFIILVVATLALIGALLSFILTTKSHKLGSFIKVGQNPSSTPQSTNQPSSTQLNYISVCAEPTCTYSALDSAIANAQHSVEVIMYELSDQLIEQELDQMLDSMPITMDTIHVWIRAYPPREFARMVGRTVQHTPALGSGR
jgi:flagellar basal body-associated protein FliL